jgi:hypothetical protein
LVGFGGGVGGTLLRSKHLSFFLIGEAVESVGAIHKRIGELSHSAIVLQKSDGCTQQQQHFCISKNLKTKILSTWFLEKQEKMSTVKISVV